MSFNLKKRLKMEMRSITIGNICDTRIINIAIFDPGKRNLEKAYPAREATNTVIPVAERHTINEFAI
jgi:hypothetical protein